MSARVKNSGARVRALGHADLHAAVSAGRRCSGVAPPTVRPLAGDDRGAQVAVRRARTQHVAGEQRPPAVAAEAAERERRGAAEVRRHVDAAAHGEVRAQAGTVARAERQRRPGGDLDRLPHRHRRAVDRDGSTGAPHTQTTAACENRSVGPAERDLEAGRARRVADREVGLGERGTGSNGPLGGTPTCQ